MGKKFLPYVRLSNSETLAGRSSDKVRRGYVPVLVGREDDDVVKLWLPTKLIGHPSIVALLNNSADEFGYSQKGLLKIFHEVDPFKRMVKSISRSNL